MRIEGVGTQLYVWSQVLGREGKTVEEELDRIFGEVAAAGLDGAEGSLSFVDTPEKARETKRLYERHRLRIPAFYTGGPFHREEEGRAAVESILERAKIARDIGCPAINTNPDPIGRDKTDEELRIQAENLNRLGRGLRDIGMTLTIHNHDPEIRHDAREFRANAALTDPDVVFFCVDTHWIYRGGGDPVALLREVVHRTKSLHLRNSTNGIWQESFREGDIDHRAIRSVLEEGGFEGWLILELAYDRETEITRPLAENIRLGAEYLRSVFGIGQER